MSETKIIWHTYSIRNRKKDIKSISGLKRYCTVNSLNFHEMLIEKGFNFSHNLSAKHISHKCRLCSKDLKIFQIDENTKTVFVSLCACNVASSLMVTRERFLTIFDENEKDTIYAAYCKNKMRRWTTKGIPVATLEFKKQKFGDEEGIKRYEEICKKFDSVSIDYFLKNGYSIEEAARKCSTRQSTFSLNKCIEKYGPAEGVIKWRARQDKWQNTLNSKSEEEIEKINRSKLYKAGVSSISKSLFLTIHKEGDFHHSSVGEKMISYINGTGKKKRAMVDFCRNNKIIEFFGDFWHANPFTYSSNDVINFASNKKPFARDVWGADCYRINKIIEQGYDMLIVWEHDYKKYPDDVIRKCNEFLNA